VLTGPPLEDVKQTDDDDTSIETPKGWPQSLTRMILLNRKCQGLCLGAVCVGAVCGSVFRPDGMLLSAGWHAQSEAMGVVNCERISTSRERLKRRAVAARLPGRNGDVFARFNHAHRCALSVPPHCTNDRVCSAEFAQSSSFVQTDDRLC